MDTRELRDANKVASEFDDAAAECELHARIILSGNPAVLDPKVRQLGAPGLRAQAATFRHCAGEVRAFIAGDYNRKRKTAVEVLEHE